MDFLFKELVGVYEYSNIHEDRDSVKEECINGRHYMKFGTATATTVVALQYKVYNPSVEQSEYITLMGVARQNPGDVAIDEQFGYEIATENAMINPVLTVKYDHKCNEDAIDLLMRNYVDGLRVQFVKTRQELENDNANVSKYNRNNKADYDYWTKYRREYKKIFRK